MTQEIDGFSLLPGDRRDRHPVNLRSVSLGLAGVLFICGLTPYNDYVMNNSSLLGSYMPAGLLLFFALFIAAVNAPLAKFAPRWAFSSSELAVALSMTLISCSLPSLGLMGFLPAHLIGLRALASQDPRYGEVLDQLDLPSWLFPHAEGSTAFERAMDPVVSSYLSRASSASDGFVDHFLAVPWSAWLVPAVTWGILVALVGGMVICLCLVVRRQWMEIERLPFPLAAVFLSLIEAPPNGAPGMSLFRSRGFQIAFAIVFAIHLLNGLSEYSSKFPAIPLMLNVGPLFGDTPFRYTELVGSPLRLQFILVGVMFFVQGRMAMSLWGFFLLGQGMMMYYGVQGSTLTNAMRTDEQFGSLITYGVFIVWIGRRHFAYVVSRMFRRRTTVADDADERYLPDAVAGWGLVACAAGISGWLVFAGASPGAAMLIVLMMMLLFTVMARVIAETGLPIGEIPVAMGRTWIFLLNELPAAFTMRTTPRSFFFTSFFTGLFTWDMREAMPVYASHALKVGDAGAFDSHPTSRHRQKGIAFVGALALALVVGYICSGASMLYSEYTHAATLDIHQSAPINGTVIFDKTAERLLEPVIGYLPPRTGPIETFNRSGHFIFGAAVTAAMGYLRLRFVNWPLHPAGFLVANTGPMRLSWFSIFIGWLSKALIVRFGGPTLFAAAKPVFLGLIIGETAGGAFWFLANVLLYSFGVPYHKI